MGDLKHEKGTKEAIMELKSLIHWQRMGSNSPGKLKISGSLDGRITKTLIYGQERKSETDFGIDKIKNALRDFAKQAKNKIKGKRNNIKKETNSRKVEKVEIRENNNN